MFNTILKYGAYTLGASIISEIGLYYYKRSQEVKESREQNSVLWTNDLSQSCKHKADEMESCENKSCYLSNIRRIVGMIDDAKYSIDLSMYIFTSFELGQAIIRAHKRGLKIRIIADETMVHSTNSQIITLNKSGIPVRYETKSTMLMHHKFCIFDGPRRVKSIFSGKNMNIPKDFKGIILAGSTNWTFQGLAGNWDYLIVTTNSTIIDEFEVEFCRIWEDFEKFAVKQTL